MSFYKNISLATGLSSLIACASDTKKNQEKDTAIDTEVTTPAYTLYELAYYYDKKGNLDEKAGKTSLQEYFNDADPVAPLLVNLWEPWCYPCVVELPLLNDSVSQDVRILGVAYGSDDLQETLDYEIGEVQRLGDELGGWKFDNKTALWTDTWNFDTEYIRNGVEKDTLAVPSFVLFDTEGNVAWAAESSLTSDGEYTQNYIDLYDALESIKSKE